MTAQISDQCEYKGNKSSIVAFWPPIPFAPHLYGLEAHGHGTACYRGFWCEYKIADDSLVLDNLHIYNSEDFYPEFNGVSVSESGDYRGFRLYKGVNLLIRHTGKILLGRDFIDEYYIHAGFQRPYAYKELIELTFESGRLRRATDRSGIAAKMRDDGAREFNGIYPDFTRYINDGVSLDDETKAKRLDASDE